MSDELKFRTKKFGLRIIKLVGSLQKDNTSVVIGKQLLRSATSVGANYRAACRARSKADFVAKLKIVEEEADESIYWLELLIESKIVSKVKLENLLNEAHQVLAIIVSSVKTAKK